MARMLTRRRPDYVGRPGDLRLVIEDDVRRGTMSAMYRELPPPPGLAHVVECVWTRVLDSSAPVRIVPDACVDVVWWAGQGTTVAGPDTTAKVVAGEAGDVVVGMRFRPGAAGGALGFPAESVRDARVDARRVAPAFAMAEDAAPADVLARFADAVAGRSGDALVAAAAPRLGAGEDVSAVASRLGVSERQLLRRCRAAAGYGPKTLGRILRFRWFVAQVDAGRTDLAALAFELGYADQAHLTHESTRLGGLPPAALARARAGR